MVAFSACSTLPVSASISSIASWRSARGTAMADGGERRDDGEVFGASTLNATVRSDLLFRASGRQ